MIERFLKPENVRLKLKAKDKEAVLEELVDILVESGYILNKDKILNAIIAREKLCSTGFEKGVAIPHPRQGDASAVKELVAAVGLAPQGIDFDSLDGEPVKIFVLLCAPNDQEHLRALARLARILKNEEVREQILSAQKPEDVVSIVVEEERKILNS